LRGGASALPGRAFAWGGPKSFAQADGLNGAIGPHDYEALDASIVKTIVPEAIAAA